MIVNIGTQRRKRDECLVSYRMHTIMDMRPLSTAYMHHTAWCSA